jgi:hypothetical protein
MLVTREMIDLEDEVWDDPVDLLPCILVSQPRAGVPEDSLTSAVRAPAEMWTSRLAESVGDGAADAGVVALNMCTPQGRRRKKVLFMGISDEWTTPARARLNVLADVSPQCRNRNTEAQCHCSTSLCVRKADVGDGQAAEERL